jgi:hypothetical protein
LPVPRLVVSLLAASASLLACRNDSVTAASAASAGPAASPVPAAPGDTIRMDGYGAVRFGMPAAQLAAAAGEAVTVPTDGCHVIAPPSAGEPPRFMWLVDDGVLARIDVTHASVLAEGGATVGMSADELRRRYPGAILEGPHKYDPDGHTWIVGPPDAAHFVFELGGDDRVVRWRAGVPPQIDWVERCG